MSVFSEAMKQEIRNSKKTLLYLSDASGLSLDHISKMRLGKRIPKDEKKVRKLIDALECPEETAHQLYSLYKMEQMGETEWKCMMELRHLLEYQLVRAEKPENYIAVDEEEIRGKSILENEREIAVFLMQVMNSSYQQNAGGESSIYMLTGTVSEFLINTLTPFIQQNTVHCFHCFSLRRNVDSEANLYNIRFINRIMPLIQSSDRYVPYYEYVQAGTDAITNWIVGEKWLLGLDYEMKSGIVIWDEHQIAHIRNHIRVIRERRRRLLAWYPGPEEWINSLCDYREYRPEGRRLAVQKESPKSYYLEPSPCLLFLLPPEMIESHILVEGEEKEALVAMLFRRARQLMEERMVHFFTLEGVRRFTENGRLSGIPDELYRPVDLEERKIILEKYREWMETHGSEYYIIDSRQLRLAPHTSVYSTASLLNNEIALCLSIRGNAYCVIQEQGISEKIHQFMGLLESGDCVHTKEHSIQEIKRIIAEL